MNVIEPDLIRADLAATLVVFPGLLGFAGVPPERFPNPLGLAELFFGQEPILPNGSKRVAPMLPPGVP
jgi:hypothetical protein